MTAFKRESIAWLECILAERFGYQFTIHQDEQMIWLQLQRAVGWIGFDIRLPAFHRSRSDFPCGEWDAITEGWKPALGQPVPTPGLASPPQPLINSVGGNTLIHYDILGLTYWMLSRLEEVGRADLDEHNRFPATSSHAFQNGYLERPIVDEWLDILGQVMCWQWPGIELRKHQFQMKISHDVDNPSRYGFQSITGLIRSVAGDALKRRDFRSAIFAPWLWLSARRRLHPRDPFNTFDWLMDQSDAHNLISAFYFICGRTEPTRDARYDPEQPALRALMRRIHKRGHEVGLHPSYNTFQTPKQIRFEADRLRHVCAEEGIEQTSWGGRMHFLRWEHPTTLRAWDEAGMDYDSTLGYADRLGFRCGTCYEYPAFDPVTQEQLCLRVRPLIAMECTIMADRYMGFGKSEATRQKLAQMKDRCRAFEGCFTLLWHNSQLTDSRERQIYLDILAA